MIRISSRHIVAIDRLDSAVNYILKKPSKDPKKEDENWLFIISFDKMTPEIIRKYGSRFSNKVWSKLAFKNAIPSDLIDKYSSSFDDGVWISILNYKPSLTKKYMDKFGPYVLKMLVENGEVTTPESIAKCADKLNDETWFEIAKRDPTVLNKYADKFGDLAWSYFAKIDEITPKIIEMYGHKFGDATWFYFTKINEITPKIIEMYGHKLGSYAWANLIADGKITKDQIDKYGYTFHDDAWQDLAWSRIMDLDMVRKYADKFSEEQLFELAKDIPEFKKYLTLRDRMKGKVTNVSTPKVRSGEQLYKMLVKRQELQYKYDSLKGHYGSKQIPEDSNLPVIEFNLVEVNKAAAKYMYGIIKDWRVQRLGLREFRITEMELNEEVMKDLQSSMASRDVEGQRIAIEKALNTIHSSGPMIEHYGLSKGRLDFLSDMDTSQWDKDMERMSRRKSNIRISLKDKF